MCSFFVFFLFFSSLLCRVSMHVCVLVDFIFCSYLMGSCQCFVAFLSSSLWIATACDCWLLEQNKMKKMNEKNALYRVIPTTWRSYRDYRLWRHFIPCIVISWVLVELSSSCKPLQSPELWKQEERRPVFTELLTLYDGSQYITRFTIICFHFCINGQLGHP